MNSEIILWIALLYLLKCSCNISNNELALLAALVALQQFGCGFFGLNSRSGNSCNNNCGCSN